MSDHITFRRIFAAPCSNPLAGEWTDAEDAVETFEALRARFGDTDIEVMDHEGFGTLEPFTFPERIVEIDEEIEVHGAALVAWRRYHGNREADDIQRFENAYRGEWSSDREFGEETADDMIKCSGAPEEVTRYFDYDSWTRDMMFDHFSQDGFYFTAF